MGVTKIILEAGNDSTAPRKGDIVSIEYTGWILESSMPERKGKQFDTSAGRGPFRFKIGLGSVIRGWDEGILGGSSLPAMRKGEKSRLIVTSDYAYGNSGFPGHIPPNASLVFDVELVEIKRDDK